MSPHVRPALAPGFNPQSLPDVAPPVAGARSWQWLAERGADRAERETFSQRQQGRRLAHDSSGLVQESTELEAYMQRFPAGFGTVDPDHRDLVVRPVRREQVIASHLDQDVVFDFAGAPQVTVRLSRAEPHEAEGVLPFTGPVAIVGTVPPSRHAVQVLGRNLREDLQRHLESAGIGYRPAFAVDRARRWLEGALIVDYTDSRAVRWAARLFLQPFLTVWREEAGRQVLDVVDLDPGPDERVVATGFASLGRVRHRPCPLIPGAGSADLCKMRGGPWTSGSITAAGRWERKRARWVDAQGCDTCGNAAITVFLGRPNRVDGGRNTRDVRLDQGVRSRHDELVAPDPGPSGRDQAVAT